mmetsp:Transcript_5990/g.21472  ORF Transcript_5990/g.21472 Transcript_5990/m.21472 type:complete len:221 (+) Transcript_5990:1662-2324(+)
MVALLALKTSHWCSLVVFLTDSLWNSSALGASWKYRYPPRASSAPSPLSTIFTPRALIFLASKNMGTAARTWCQDSRWYTTLGTASMASSGVKWNSWCVVPKKSATFLAFSRSGAPLIPMEKVWSFSDQSNELVARSRCFAAIAVTREESRPPESNTPKGTSAISLLSTASMTVSLTCAKSTAAVGTYDSSVTQRGSYHLMKSGLSPACHRQKWPGGKSS